MLKENGSASELARHEHMPLAIPFIEETQTWKGFTRHASWACQRAHMFLPKVCRGRKPMPRGFPSTPTEKRKCDRAER